MGIAIGSVAGDYLGLHQTVNAAQLRQGIPRIWCSNQAIASLANMATFKDQLLLVSGDHASEDILRKYLIWQKNEADPERNRLQSGVYACLAFIAARSGFA